MYSPQIGTTKVYKCKFQIEKKCPQFGFGFGFGFGSSLQLTCNCIKLESTTYIPSGSRTQQAFIFKMERNGEIGIWLTLLGFKALIVGYMKHFKSNVFFSSIIPNATLKVAI